MDKNCDVLPRGTKYMGKAPETEIALRQAYKQVVQKTDRFTRKQKDLYDEIESRRTDVRSVKSLIDIEKWMGWMGWMRWME